MAFSFDEHTTANGTSYAYTFDAVTHDTSNIKVTIGGKHLFDGVTKYNTNTRVPDDSGSVQTVEYTLTGDSTGGTITINSNVNISGVVTNGVPTLSTNQILRIFRQTNRLTPEVSFSSDSVLTDTDLNKSNNQARFLSLEAVDRADESISIDANNSSRYNVQIEGADKRIFGVATPVDQNDAVNKAYIDQNGNVSTVAGLNSEIALLGTSAMATATTGHIPVLANVVEQTVNYTVTVVNSKFNIQGGEYGSATEAPILTLIRGYTYVFDVSNSAVGTSVAGHPLVFKNGNTTLGTSDGVTTTGTAGQAGAKVTVVVSDSVTITKYSCSTHGDNMGNTITLRHDDFKEVADVASNIPTVAGVASNIPTVAGASVNIGLVAGEISPTNNISTVANKINHIDNFNDTYHTPGTTEPSGSNVTEGDLWYDTANDVLKVYDGSSWGSASSSIATVASQNEFTASNGQGTGNKYFALVHDVGLELVFLNGVRLKRGSDYYCTNSNTSTTPIVSGNSATFIRLETVPGSNDILSVMAFGQIVNNLAVNTAGGTFTGGVTFEAGTTHNTGNNTFTMPTTRGLDNYVLTRDDSVGTGGTAWKETVTPPSISTVTTPASDNSINEDTNVTMTINGTNFNNTMTVSLVDATSGATVTGHGNLGIANFVSSAQITVNTVAATSNISNSNVKVKVDKSGLTATSPSISVSPDPTFSAPSSNGTTLATMLDVKAGNVEVVGSSGIVASATDSATITYALDQTSTNANNTWQFNTTTGVVKTPTAGVYDVPSGSSYTEPFTVTATAGGDSSRTVDRTFNIIVNKTPTSTNSGGVGIISDYTGYRVHTWTTVGTHTNDFTTYSTISVDILVVGAGGGGGWDVGGGGGAGQMGVWQNYSLPAGSYTIEVGFGGNGAQHNSESGDDGGNSRFGTLTQMAGGGGGGTWHSNNAGYRSGNNGGSGGGECGWSTSNSTYGQNASNAEPGSLSGTTYSGGASIDSGAGKSFGSDGGENTAHLINSTGGGGGGAGGAGGVGIYYSGSTTAYTENGGAGLANWFRTGSNVTYATGGRGANDIDAGNPSNEPDNTGNGGIGGGAAGYKGGSGIVVVRYAI